MESKVGLVLARISFPTAIALVNFIPHLFIVLRPLLGSQPAFPSWGFLNHAFSGVFSGLI